MRGSIEEGGCKMSFMDGSQLDALFVDFEGWAASESNGRAAEFHADAAGGRGV